MVVFSFFRSLVLLPLRFCCHLFVRLFNHLVGRFSVVSSDFSFIFLLLLPSLCHLFWRLLSLCLFLFLVLFFLFFSYLFSAFGSFLHLAWFGLRPIDSLVLCLSIVSSFIFFFLFCGCFCPYSECGDGVASSALGGDSDGSSSRGIFSVAPVPEDSVSVCRILWRFQIVTFLL